MSSRTSPGRTERAVSAASAPVAASATVNPAASSMPRANVRKPSWSSTIRIEAADSTNSVWHRGKPLASGPAPRFFLDRPERIRGSGPIPREAGIPSVGTNTRQEGTAEMTRTGRLLAAAVSLAAVASLAATACSAPASPAPEQAAVLNWLAKTNAMWTQNDFAALDEITTAEMRTIYLAERHGASLPSNASRQPFQLTGLSITIPCQSGRPGVFVAYGDTDVFDLGPAMQPMAMVFQRSGGRWKLAAAVNRPARGWPALCTEARRRARRPPSPPPTTRPNWPGC